MNLINLRNFCSSVDLQLLLYIVGVAEALVYGLVGITYVCALVAFNKASEKYLKGIEDDEESQSEEKEVTMFMESEALIQIFGILMFLIVSVVMVSGVIEVSEGNLFLELLVKF
jgi:Ca2+/Na+ antiporter